MSLGRMENGKEGPLPTAQSHSFIGTETPANHQRVEENAKDKVTVKQKLIWEKYTSRLSL